MTVRSSFLEIISTSAAWLSRNKQVDVQEETVKINLGSGLIVAPGWINLDRNINALVAAISPQLAGLAYRFFGAKGAWSRDAYVKMIQTSRFVHHDLRYGIPMKDESAHFLYTSHFLEHLSEEEGRRLLREIHRVLKPGGRTRIVVPDMTRIVELWTKGDKAQALRNLFNPGAPHLHMYDESSLADALTGVGFQEVKSCSYREGDVPDLDVLDSKQDQSLYMQATK